MNATPAVKRPKPRTAAGPHLFKAIIQVAPRLKLPPWLISLEPKYGFIPSRIGGAVIGDGWEQIELAVPASDSAAAFGEAIRFWQVVLGAMPSEGRLVSLTHPITGG